MKHDDQLKLQAFLDGELAAREAAEVQTWLERDTDGRALLAELRQTNAALLGHESRVQLPESREFFWSKIEREISRIPVPAPATRPYSWLARLRRQLVPLSGIATVTVIFSVVALHSLGGAGRGDEMELTSQDMGAYTYRDQANKMTVVWFYDRSTPEAEPETPVLPDPQ